MEQEILEFAEKIGAIEPKKDDAHYDIFRALFRERNYFRHKKGFIVIKLSRNEKPFYGLTKEIIDFLNKNIEYKLILLKPSDQGLVFNKREVNDNINSKKWNIDSTGKKNTKLMRHYQAATYLWDLKAA